jgi:hypothetical protein
LGCFDVIIKWKRDVFFGLSEVLKFLGKSIFKPPSVGSPSLLGRFLRAAVGAFVTVLLPLREPRCAGTRPMHSAGERALGLPSVLHVPAA